MKKILVVLTNVDKYATKDEPTGLWLSEATHFIEEFDHNDNVQIDLVSPKGGNVPLDPKSLATLWMRAPKPISRTKRS